MTPPISHSGGRGRVDALDGLRGFALLGMMAWHAQVSWVQGGFARMTVFFVLAGFLAARSLTRSPGDSIARRFARFWTRRAQRLLPVTLLAVGVGIAVTWAIGGPRATRSVFGDAASVLTFWSNWRFVAQERVYGEIFESPSAFEHFWSLSLEEQCLIVLPLLLVVIMAVVRDRNATPTWRTIAAVLVVASASSSLPLFVEMSNDTAYYGTHVRLGEFLVGVALALWIDTQRIETWSTAHRRVWGLAGTTGFALLVAIMLSVDRESAWVYRGGMGIIAVPVAATIVAILIGARPLVWVLGVAPLAALGRAAFSIYALHWPIFLVVEHQLDGSERAVIVGVEFVAALVIGALVYRLYERPLMPGATSRVGRMWARPQIAFGSATVVGVAVLVLAQQTPVREPPIDFEEAAADETVSATVSLEDALAILDDPTTATPSLPVFRDDSRLGVALYGGSTALALALGVGDWADDATWAQNVPGYSPLGCGLIVGVERAGPEDPGNHLPAGQMQAECHNRVIRWQAITLAYQIDIPIVVASSSDLTAHRFVEDGPWLALGDAEFDARVAQELIDTVHAWWEIGIDTVYATTHVAAERGFDIGTAAIREARIAAYRSILFDLQAQGYLEVIDVYAHSAALDDEAYDEAFPDGVHPSEPGSQRLWHELVGPAIAPAA